MAKKKSRPKKSKPLLSVQGIVHLNNSFVTPSDECGLLTTVGGKEKASFGSLILAPNYGYGIPASTLEVQCSDENSTEEDANKNLANGSSGSPKPEINGSMAEDEKNENGKAKAAEKDDDDLSVAQLVRNIGGAKDLPLYQKDVVEDRDLPKEIEVITIDDPIDEETQAQTDEFYASIDRPNPNAKQQSTGSDSISTSTNINTAVAVTALVEEVTQVAQVNQKPSSTNNGTPLNQTDSIAEYYKTYCHYYYSAVPDPQGDQPLEFSTTIDPSADPNIDESVFELARLAQKARRAMDAGIEAKRQEALKAKQEAENKIQRDNDAFDPLPMEIVQNEYEVINIDTTTTLTQYWDYVKENPHDFNRWTYLIHYVETINNLSECRNAYSAFLPLFPYCFGYWKRYAEIEKAHHYFYRSLSILSRGLEFTPLSVDLWLSYINLFSEVHAHDNNFEELVREQFNKALRIVGLEFRSDAFWEAYLQWETNKGNLKNVFAIYRRLIQVPTRIYNRHCDNVRALVRDHHPRDFLSRAEYERMRKRGCKLLKLKYKEEPELEPGEIRKTKKPEDKLMAHVKEILLEKITAYHSKTEIEVDKRWDYEDKIKRPYFHIKALDKKQLKNWAEYLSFEIKEGNHDRIVLLFERCITACAHYEFYWCRYARYLENYHKKNTKEISVHFQKSHINVEIVVPTKETEEEEARVEAAFAVVESLINEIERAEEIELRRDIQLLLKTVINQVVEQCCDCDERSQEVNANELLTSDDAEKVSLLSAQDNEQRDIIGVVPTNLDGNSCSIDELPPKSGELQNNENKSSASGYTSLLSVPTFPPTIYRWQEVVRDIYKRGSIVHCPRKPTIRLQWAAYEEELGNMEETKQLIQHVLEWFPELLESKLQLIEFERRNGNKGEALINLYEEFLKSVRSKAVFSVISLKYSNFLFKELGKADKALLVLRKAVTKDRGNARVYLAIYALCYERFPSDRKGALAALELAIQSKLLTNEEKLIFHKKKLLFLQEHGEISKYRDAIDKFNECKEVVDLAKEAEIREKTAYDVPNQYDVETTKANVSMQPFPVPTWSSVTAHNTQNPTPIEFEPATQTQTQHKEKEEEDVYKNVPPTRELLVNSNYGYSSRHPDQKLIENIGHKEYEKLETEGYPEHLKNKEGDTSSSKKRKADTPLYIVAPKGSYLMSYLGGPNHSDNPPVPGGAVYLEGMGNKRMKLEAPLEMSSLILPTSSPCINVPEWFVKEGGELCLSETARGFSILRYWPHFLNESGNKKMFRSIRKGVKWHQKQILVGGRWKHMPRLISWLGPCEYSHNGMVIGKNEDWPPEVLDLLHRLIKMTHYEFNSCSLNLYRSGHDSNAWHSDIHQALGSNPPVASVSLGALRYFELRKKGYEQNFIRFPLFPGSLLMMEGATQEDWVHQVPKDPSIKEERINLTFRVMHAIEDPETPNTAVNKTGSETEKVKDTSVLSTANATKSEEEKNKLVLPIHGTEKYKKLVPLFPEPEKAKPKPTKPVVSPVSGSEKEKTVKSTISIPSSTRISFRSTSSRYEKDK